VYNLVMMHIVTTRLSRVRKHAHCGLQVPGHEQPQQCRNTSTADRNTKHEDLIHINSQVIKEGKNSKTFMSQLHCLPLINPPKCYSVNFPNTWIFKQADFMN